MRVSLLDYPGARNVLARMKAPVVQTQATEPEEVHEFSLAPVAARLSELLGTEVPLLPSLDAAGTTDAGVARHRRADGRGGSAGGVPPWPSHGAADGGGGDGVGTVDVLVKGPGSGRESAVRALQAGGLSIKSIKDVTPIPHNGCRPPKRRRV